MCDCMRVSFKHCRYCRGYGSIQNGGWLNSRDSGTPSAKLAIRSKLIHNYIPLVHIANQVRDSPDPFICQEGAT